MGEWLERPVKMKELLLMAGAVVLAGVLGWSRNSVRIDATEEAVESLPEAIKAIREATEAMNSVSQSVTLNVDRPLTDAELQDNRIRERYEEVSRAN